MIIACPNCGKRYLIPDDKIGPTGRAVRCVACGTGWHQDPPPETPEPEAVEAPEPAPAPESSAPPPPRAEPPSPPPSWAAPVAQETPAPPSPRFQPREEPRGRRNPAPLWTAAAIIAAALLLVLLLLLKPGGLAGIDLGARLEPEMKGTALRLQAYEPNWGRVLDGRSVLTINGRIENPTRVELPIPPLHAELRDPNGTLVASWTSPAPLPALPGGAAISFDTAAVDIAPGASTVSLSFATPRE